MLSPTYSGTNKKEHYHILLSFLLGSTKNYNGEALPLSLNGGKHCHFPFSFLWGYSEIK